MIVMADMSIYFLLGLLLDGYSTYYGQGNGSRPNEDSGLMGSLVFYGLYLWFALNIGVVLLLVYRKILDVRKGQTKVKNISK